MTLPARQITTRAGVVIESVDISAEPSGEVIAVLRGALNEHEVTVTGGVPTSPTGGGAANWPATYRITRGSWRLRHDRDQS
jgi:hypothetical protein